MDKKSKGQKRKRNDSDSEKREDCGICMDSFLESSKTSWKELSCCKYKLCTGCFNTLNKTGKTMAGVTSTYFKCPFCQHMSGIQIGNCPTGRMIVSPPSRDARSFIMIQYIVNQGRYQLNRTAYLPNTTEGREVLGLLKTAFDRRLTFTIGTSVTTGQTDVLVWNIHHKTSTTGGISRYGFPDPTYLFRVKEELLEYGIQ